LSQFRIAEYGIESWICPMYQWAWRAHLEEGETTLTPIKKNVDMQKTFER
jgi:hypothetical protein